MRILKPSRWVALVALLIAPASRAADAPPAPAASATLPSLDAFYAKPTYSNARLSPDGQYLAYVLTAENGKAGDLSVLMVVRLADADAKPILRINQKGAEVSWLSWKDDNRLLLGLTLLDIKREGDKPSGDLLSWRYGQFIVALDRDGKNQIQLLKGDFWNTERGSLASLLDRLKADPDHILAIAPNRLGDSAIWKVNVRTGEAVDIENGGDGVQGWTTDSTGAVVARYRMHNRSWIIEARAPGESTWTTVAVMKPKELKVFDDFQVMGAAEKPNQLYVIVKPRDKSEGDTRQLRIFDAATKTLSAPIWPALKYDVDDIVYDGDTGRLGGVCYTADTYVCDFIDHTTAANYRGLEKYFRGDRSLSPVSVTRDGRWWLLDVSGPDEPGGYYLFDKTTARIQLFAERFKDLPPEQLGVMERYAYPARDGVSIPGYLTRPRNVAKGPLPLIVLPHGGPEARDAFQYDTWSQILATRGYLVFQPNFRGSGGYGVAYAEAGYGQWGGRMADDITDGVRKLIESGQVDPSRICIVGASYGGYAALFAGATHPELYKCVVSWAGSSDLLAAMSFVRRTDGKDSATYRYWLKSKGDPDKDAAAMKAASPVTYAAGYKPPVLLIHGDADDIVDPEQSRIMERALKRAGRSVKLIIYRNEGHPEFEPEDQKAAFGEVIKFIGAHIAPAVSAPPPTGADAAPVAKP